MYKRQFYATSGGQEADKGIIRTADGEFIVEDVVKLLGGKFGHSGYVSKGMIKVGDKATLEVDPDNRMLSANNNSATHLLHKALRLVLGLSLIHIWAYDDGRRHADTADVCDCGDRP